MALNPLAPVTDYQSMLNRIFWFTTAAALGAVGLLRAHILAIDVWLAQLDMRFQTAEGGLLPIGAGYLARALSVGLLMRVYRLHGQVSHWLGISERFDVDVIMAELARQVGLDTTSAPDQQWLAHRHRVMQQAFYRFASSSAPQIDGHLIYQALDLWSWFWIGVQSTVVFVIASLVLIAFGAYGAGATALAVTLALAAAGLPTIRRHCERYAIAQVKAIVADPARAAVVRQAFSWLVPREKSTAAAA